MTDGVEFDWVPGADAPDELLRDCSELFGGHYGRYSPAAPHRAGQPILFSVPRIAALVRQPGCGLAVARAGGRLVSYAATAAVPVPGLGRVSWVSQLVTHRDFRERKVATRLIRSVWAFSDDFAWGLATSNPYAVRALESATRRACDPAVIGRHAGAVRDAVAGPVAYLRDRPLDCPPDRSVVDTAFHVDHARVDEKIRNVTRTRPWLLGRLGEGEEWFAVTFREQPPSPLTPGDWAGLLEDAEGTARRAYSRMTLDAGHRWAKHTDVEVEFLVGQAALAPGASALDIGCGPGRHAIALAARGVRVVGVDFVPRFVEQARGDARDRGLSSLASFREADARRLDLQERFDLVTALYDVIGSFPDEESNRAIVRTVARHARPGGTVVASVMNREMTERVAVYKGPVLAHLNALQSLPPSPAMQSTGEVFDPGYIFADPETGLTYRREQFSGDRQLPWEVIVRDRRYRADEVVAMFRAEGVEPVIVRHVRSGRWDADLAAGDESAKEVLFVGRRVAGS